MSDDRPPVSLLAVIIVALAMLALAWIFYT